MRFRSLFLVATMLVSTAAARADLIQFNIDGADNFSGTQHVSGTTTIDTTNGIVTAISFTTLPNNFMYSVITGQTDQGDVGVSGTDGIAQFTFTDPLKGYSGGTFNLRVPNATIYNGHTMTIRGTIDPISATPEPSSLALLSTGLLGVAGVLKRRMS